jgi:hypothetical protein
MKLEKEKVEISTSVISGEKEYACAELETLSKNKFALIGESRFECRR